MTSKKNFKKEILKATKEKFWLKYRNFIIYHSLRGLHEEMIVRPVACGSPRNMNPMAFVSFPIRKNNTSDIECAFRFFSHFC